MMYQVHSVNIGVDRIERVNESVCNSFGGFIHQKEVIIKVMKYEICNGLISQCGFLWEICHNPVVISTEMKFRSCHMSSWNLCDIVDSFYEKRLVFCSWQNKNPAIDLYLHHPSTKMEVYPNCIVDIGGLKAIRIE